MTFAPASAALIVATPLVETGAPIRGATIHADHISVAREVRARASIEAKRGAPYTDAEWHEAQQNLLAFFGVLAEWKAKEIPNIV